ncbi:hypothetical protein [Anaplasma centrale]|uniref:hypothetical protein n=1 Tax=Anaplasma centrale TaxID=769 RepID=UPI0003147465|nr:hypothetical protein [Anaplasma centrale]
MGDVKRFRKEVVDSIGAGTASPVRAVFSSAVLGSAVPSADGDTFLMGEMVGVDEGLVIQELSRADELVKLQHELEKQVSKLAELGELKWLGELEKLQAEEIQKVKDSIGEMEKEKIREVETAKGEFEKEIEEIKGDLEKLAAEKMKEVVMKVGFNELGLEAAVKKEVGEKLWSKEPEKVKEALEKIKVEELKAKVKDKIGELVKEVEKIKEVKDKVEKLEKKLGELEGAEELAAEKVIAETKKIEEAKEEVEQAKKEWEKVAVKLKKLVQGVKDLKSKLEELETIKGVGERLKDDIEKIKEPGDLDLLEAKKIAEVKTAKEGVVTQVGSQGIKALGDLGAAIEKAEGVEEKSLGELVKRLEGKLGPYSKEKLEALKDTLEELAAIRELKELGLEERLRELAEVKEVKRLAERQKAGELDVQGGLQLTEKIRALSVGIVGGLGRLEARRLGENTDGGLAEKLGILGRLASGERSQTLAEVKAALKRLKEMKIRELKTEVTKDEVKRNSDVGAEWEWLAGFGAEGKTLEEVKQEWEKEKESLEKLVKKLGDSKQLEAVRGELQKKEMAIKGKLDVVHKLEKKGQTKELKNLKNKLDELSKIKALEELTEIAEKRGVATVMKAALTSAMEITKNRGWTDYLNKVDSGKKSDAVKELIAAEKIRKLTQYINTLEVWQQCRELQVCILVLLLQLFSPHVLLVQLPRLSLVH